MEGKPDLLKLTRQEDTASAANAWNVLRQFGRRPQPAERCELCSTAVGQQHNHLVELATRRILCACDACALLFDGSSGRKYKRVPRRVQFLQSFSLQQGHWDALLIPINMAFFFFSSTERRMVALYPSPAGAVESLLTLEAWNDIVAANPVLTTMEPDVEALLVNRAGQAREHFIAPIDECYKLVGFIRAHWRGLSGGDEVWQKIKEFFAGLRQNAEVANKETRA